MKVFGIGFQKTGTTTLGAVLIDLGYSVCGDRGDLVETLLHQNLNPIYNVVEQFDAFQDNPWPLIYKDLDNKYPNSKFILTIRSEEKWINSIVNHFGETQTEMRKWIYGIGHPKGNEDIYLDKYIKHNQDVIDFFKNRKDDLLIVSWEENDEWEKICNFLNKPIPTKKFPHKNKGQYSTQLKILNKIKSWLKN